MLKEHCFDRKYVIEPYGTIFATLVTKGLISVTLFMSEQEFPSFNSVKARAYSLAFLA